MRWAERLAIYDYLFMRAVSLNKVIKGHSPVQLHTDKQIDTLQKVPESRKEMLENNQHQFRPHRSNAEYGVVAAPSKPLYSESSFDSRVPNLTSANYSNVQIVCRIKASQVQQIGQKSSTKRPNSACRVNFQSYQAPAFKGKDTSTMSRNAQLKINPSRSFMSVQSTPAMSSSSLEYQRNNTRGKADQQQYVSLRSRMRPLNGGMRFHSNGSPFDSKRQSTSAQKTMLSQSGISLSSSNAKVKGPAGAVGTLGGARQDTKACVFTTTQERSNQVVITETPISMRIVNEKLQEASQMRSFMQLCNSNGYDANVFDFDNVFSDHCRQDRFYAQSVKPLVQSFVEGENGCVLLFGPTQSGKTYSLHGKAGKERGVVPRAIEDILSIVKNTYDQNLHGADQIDGSSLIEDYGTDTQPILSVNTGANDFLQFGIPKAILQGNSHIQVYGADTRDYDAQGCQDRIFIKMSVYMIYCDRIYDLLSSKAAKKTVKVEHYIDQASQQVVTKFTNMTEKLVLNLEQYYALIQDAFKERKTVSMKLTDHEIRKRSHLIVSLGLVSSLPEGGPMREVSRLNFSELCGSEQSVAQSGQARDTTIRQFVTKSFNCLSTQILKSALGKRTQLEEGDSGLIASLKNTLTSKSNVLLVACASPSPSFYDHSLPAIKFCGRIRDIVVRKLQRQGFQTSRTQHDSDLCLNQQNLHQQSQRVMKQTRFNLAGGEKSTTNTALSTFGRVSQHGASQRADEDYSPRPDHVQSQYQSSLKKPHLRRHSRSGSPTQLSQAGLPQLDEILALSKQLQNEIQIYDSLMRQVESSQRGRAAELEEVREWCTKSLESLDRALQTFNKGHGDFTSKSARQDSINALFYMKERITSIQQKAMTVSPFEGSISPRSKGADTALRQSVGTTNAATLPLQDGRDNPFNQVVNGLGSAARMQARELRGDSAAHTSGQSSVNRRIEDPSYTSSVKNREPYRTYDERRDTRSFREADLGKEPYQSRLGRELSERIQAEKRTESDSARTKVPMSARDGERKDNHHHSLRDFSRSASQGRRQGSESQRVVQSPAFLSSQHPGKKEEYPAQDSGQKKAQQMEEKSSPLKLTNAKNDLDLQQLQSKFLSSQRVSGIIRSTFSDVVAPKHHLYASAEETLADIQRLIMLDDFEGLRRRVVQLFKERQGCDEVIQVKEVELEELREQLDARDDAVRHLERQSERNTDQYMATLKEEQLTREKAETQSSMHIRNLQQSIEVQTAELDGLKSQRDAEAEKIEHMTTQFELNNRLRLEAESKLQRLQEENEKLYTNYDVLKEHELNIIKDFQDKRKADQRTVGEQMSDLRAQLDEKNEELNQQKKQIIDLEGELRKQEFETRRVQEQKTLQSDAQGIVQEKLDREKGDNKQLRDKIARLEGELERERNCSRAESSDKKLALQEIKQLQDLIREMEGTIERVTGELQDAKNLTQDRQDQIRELDTQKRIYEERMALKDREMSSHIVAADELTEQLALVKKEYEELDTKHVKLRAAEFDKVDVLKVNAEMEGKLKNLQIDLENLICERNKLQDRVNQLEQTNLLVDTQAKQAQQELDYVRQTHEAAMDKFETKFVEFSQELGELTDQNSLMKEREKKHKRTINKLEVANLELDEKLKYSLQRNNDLNHQVEFVGRDMQKLAQETGEQVQLHMRTAEQSQRRTDATDRAFADIKSMISQFRNERNSSKDKLATTRGRYSRDCSPDGQDGFLKSSARQSSSSPDAWKRERLDQEWRQQQQRMSPLRQNNQY